MKRNILVTGGTGRLAAELRKHLDATYVGIEDFDFIYGVDKREYDLIVHMAAWTDVAKAEKEREKCFDTNVKGTWKVSDAFPDTPIVYVSTEYAHKPIGVYAKTKRWGEEIVKDHAAPHLILRTSFKPYPFPYDRAYEDQMTQGGYTHEIAELLAKRVTEWDGKESGFEFLGTGRKTMLELARQSRPEVQPMKVEEYVNRTGAPIPYDYED